MAFGDDDLRAMESDFGVPVQFRGADVGPCLFGDRLVTDQAGGGLDVQRRAQVLRVRAGELAGWVRDEPITIDRRPYRLRQRVDDAQTVDGAWELIEVGR